MNALRLAPGIKASAAHVILCGPLLLLALTAPRLTIAQQAATQEAKPQIPSIGGSTSTADASVIRSHVRQVLFDIVVTDFRDRPVSGLRQADFSVYEDGKIQQVLSFEAHAGRSGADVRTSPALPPNTILSAPSPVDSLPLNIILLDFLNTPVEAQAAGRDELIKLLRKKAAGMRIAVFVLRDRLRLLEGFTDSDTELLTAMKKKDADLYLSRSLPANPDNLTAGEILTTRGVTDVSGGGTSFSIAGLQSLEIQEQTFYLSRRIEMTIEAFAQISHFVSATPGRKNLIWLSASFPMDITLGSRIGDSQSGLASIDPFAENYSPKLRELTDRLTLSQVAVYPVDIRGLTTDFPLDAANSHHYEHTGDFDLALHNAQVTRGAELEVMDKIAQDSGGHAFYNTNGLQHAMETALDDGSTYYTISYSPTNTRFDGGLRHIRVALEATKSYRQLSYRRAYFADDPDKLRDQAQKTPFGPIGCLHAARCTLCSRDLFHRTHGLGRTS